MSQQKNKEPIVITVGGSLLIPQEINVRFIQELKEIVALLAQQKYQIALVIGGGKTARMYQNAARNFSSVSDIDLDWIGIKTIALNAELILRIFSDLDIHKKVIEHWEEAKGLHQAIIIAGAYEPGCSSDTDAVELAEVLGAQRIINFSNISHVYSEDPRKNPNAQKFEKLSWSEYRSLIPKEWTPGLSAPFDPVASELAEKYGMKVVILGASLENLKAYLNSENFGGTIIE